MRRPIILSIFLAGWLVAASSALIAQDRAALGAREVADLEAGLKRLAVYGAERTVGVKSAFGMGSGGIVDGKGLVITNAHVAAFGLAYRIVRHDGSEVVGRRLWVNYARDLALIELPRDEYPAFELRAERPADGDFIVALGHPGGVQPDGTPAFGVGVVTGKKDAMEVMGFLSYEDAIISDVPLFPGNSGGPLLDLEGRLVGVNGAVELTGGVSYSVPAEVVRTNVQGNARGLVILPGGMQFNLNGIPGLDGILGSLDTFSDEMLKRQDEMAKRLEEGGDKMGGLLEGADDAPPFEAGPDPIMDTARATPRNRLLGEAFAKGLEEIGHGAVLKVDEGRAGFATLVAPGRALCKASLLGGNEVQLADRRARVLARDDATDLALLSFDPGDKDQALDLAGEAPSAGTIVHALGTEGRLLGSGVVSVFPRSVRPQALADAEEAQKRLIKTIARLLRGLGNLFDGLNEFADELERSLDTRSRYMQGTKARSYPLVIQHDLPVSEAEVGSPLVDGRGSLLGITVSHPHYGTNYTIPAAEIRRIFGRHLGWKEAEPAEPAGVEEF